MTTGGTSRVRIVRRAKLEDVLRSYGIIVNGKPLGTIKRNSVLDLEVPSGTVSVEATIDWCRSRPLTFEAKPNEQIELDVANTWGPFLFFWSITFGRNEYLTLKRITA